LFVELANIKKFSFYISKPFCMINNYE